MFGTEQFGIEIGTLLQKQTRFSGPTAQRRRNHRLDQGLSAIDFSSKRKRL